MSTHTHTHSLHEMNGEGVVCLVDDSRFGGEAGSYAHMLQACQLAWNTSLPLLESKVARQVLLHPFSEMLEHVMALAGRRHGLDAPRGEVCFPALVASYASEC